MWFTHVGSPSPRLMRGIEVGDRVVVEIPHREQLAVAGVEEHVARPAGLLERRRGLDLHEREAHRLGVEGAGRVEVAGGDRNVVERHRAHLTGSP